ncbi:MAG TPA: InlB B-repeat-containing protein, partial [Clostridia bacterium]
DKNEVFTVAQGTSYFLVTTTLGSVYSPFKGVAVRTDVAEGFGGMTATQIQATLTSDSYVAFDYFQMVVNTNAGIRVSLSDGNNTISLKDQASYYVQTSQGKLISKVSTDGMVYPITSEFQGFSGRFIIPLDSFDGSINNLTSISYSSALVNRVRHSFGDVYVLDGFNPDTAITYEDVVWTAQADNYTKLGENNVTTILLNAGEFVGAPANLTAEMTNNSKVAQFKNDVMIISLPDEMKNENGFVSLEKVKGIVFDLTTTSKAKLFPLLCLVDSKYELNTLNGWQTRYANETNTWIWNTGVISVNQSAVVIYPEFDGRIVVPVTQAAFSGTNNATGDTFPTEILPYIIVEPLNNPSMCNASVTIRSVTLVDDLKPYEACSVNYDGFNATVEAGLSRNYVLPGTEVTFTVLPKIGFEFESATLNDEPVTLNSDNTFTVVVTEDVNFYVVFKAIDYTITYVLNGGTNNPENITTYQSINATFDLKDPTKEGYVFEGWYLNEDFSGEKVTSIVRGSSGDITLYAKWSKTAKASKGCGTVSGSGMDMIFIMLFTSFGVLLLLSNKKQFKTN